MIRRMAIAGASIAVALAAGGCADFMEKSVIAPDWFNAKMAEVEGKGYPELSAVPDKQGSTADQPQWDKAAASLEAEAARIDQRLKEVDEIIAKEGGAGDDASIRASAAQLRAEQEKGSAPDAEATP